MSIVKNLIDVFKSTQFTLKEAYKANPDVPTDSVRARIYENLGKCFERVGKGIYITKEKDCLVIEGNGRKLDCIEDEAIDCIITDHRATRF